MKRRRIFVIISIIVLCFFLLSFISVLAINAHVKSFSGKRIIAPEEAESLEDIDCILVLGCLVRADGTPSNMLEDRLKRGIELYYLDVSPMLLMSGDHSREDYDEVGAMKRYAEERGVPSGDILTDPLGLSTYESMKNLKDKFNAKRVIIVTQEYHLYRAIYIAEQLGIEAYGVSSDYRAYSRQFERDVREMFARVKDFFVCIF